MLNKALVWLIATAAVASAAEKPKLVLAIAIDQFRYDYLTRFRAEYKGGFDRLLTRGAVFPNAYYEHFPTVTAVGHSTFLTGAFPAVSGIIANDWFDLDSGKSVTSVSDPAEKALGSESEGGTSPRRMLVSTVGDELKMVSPRSKVIGVSAKDRSAILPAGHMADGAYWLARKTGQFVSSTFYFADLPEWVKAVNASRPADRYANASWDTTPYGGPVHKAGVSGTEKFYENVVASPYGNELLEMFAERAIREEKLGQRGVTDVLTLSLSSNDYVGHEFGPDSPEVHSISIESDRLLAKLFQYVDERVGLGSVLVVLTGDHGVAPVPEVNQARHMPGGRMPAGIIQSTAQKTLEAKYGPGKWVVSPSEHSLYFNRSLIAEKKLDGEDVRRTAAEALLQIGHVARVFTRDQLVSGSARNEMIARRVMNGYQPQRGADVMVVLEPYWMFGRSGTTHGAPYAYDAHVPVIFMGPGVKPGVVRRQVMPNDIAPTVSSLLGIDAPSGAAGRVLDEILE